MITNNFVVNGSKFKVTVTFNNENEGGGGGFPSGCLVLLRLCLDDKWTCLMQVFQIWCRHSPWNVDNPYRFLGQSFKGQGDSALQQCDKRWALLFYKKTSSKIKF